MSESKNRRKAERLDSRLFVDFETELQDSVGRGVVTDVSLSGIGVETEADLSIGEEISCHIEIPLTIKARIVRDLSEGQLKKYGLKFVNQTFFDKLLLKKLLKGRRSTKKV